MILLFVFLLISIGSFAQNEVKDNETLLWHNQQRVLNYSPNGEGFKNVNGKNRFTRAIYGTNSGFRFETSDFPEFGLYMPNFGGSVYLALSSKDTVIWVRNAKEIVSQYEKGVRSYTIKDPILGKGTLQITALAFSDADGMIVKSRAENLTEGIKLIWIYGGASNERFAREGDIGADPKDCFYIKGKNAEGNTFELKGNQFVNFYGTNKKVRLPDSINITT
jgi:hypothetical protein